MRSSTPTLGSLLNLNDFHSPAKRCFCSIFSSSSSIPGFSACYLRLRGWGGIFSPTRERHRPPCHRGPSVPRGMGRVLLLGLRALSTVLGAALGAIGHASGIERATDDVITHTREILYTTTTNQHDAVLLEVVTLSGDVGVDLFLVGQTHTGNLTHCRVRLFGGCRIDTHAHSTALRTVVQRRRLALVHDDPSAFSY